MYTSTSSVQLPAADAWQHCRNFGKRSYLAVTYENDMLSTFTYGFNEAWVSWSNHTLQGSGGYDMPKTNPMAGSRTMAAGKAA